MAGKEAEISRIRERREGQRRNARQYPEIIEFREIVAKMTLYIGLQRHNKIDGREGQEESIRQAELPLLMDSYSKDFK